MKKEKKISIIKDGPYFVSGNIPIINESIILDSERNPYKFKKIGTISSKDSYALCRCGKSKNKPFCDGTHSNIKFNGKETASLREFEENSEKLKGPQLDLKDAPSLCAGAGFCHRKGGTWSLIESSNDSKSKKEAIRQCSCCISGRLVAVDKKGNPIEPKLKQEISIIQENNNLGPLWIKGGIQIESENGKYEKRNRVALCRCGKSKNKPFCDGTHIISNFQD